MSFCIKCKNRSGDASNPDIGLQGMILFVRCAKTSARIRQATTCGFQADEAVEKTRGWCLRSCAIGPFRFIRRTLILITCYIQNPTPKMVLKLYGSAMSFACVLVTILEKDLPYEHILIDIAKGDHKSEAYKRLQPFGKVPVLDDDGFLIFESRAICKYLARQVFHSRVSFGCLMRGRKEKQRFSLTDVS